MLNELYVCHISSYSTYLFAHLASVYLTTSCALLRNSVEFFGRRKPPPRDSRIPPPPPKKKKKKIIIIVHPVTFKSMTWNLRTFFVIVLQSTVPTRATRRRTRAKTTGRAPTFKTIGEEGKAEPPTEPRVNTEIRRPNRAAELEPKHVLVAIQCRPQPQ